MTRFIVVIDEVKVDNRKTKKKLLTFKIKNNFLAPN